MLLKRRTILISLMAIFILVVLWLMTNVTRPNISVNSSNCGEEIRNVIRQGYNASMRRCFFDAFQVCELADISYNFTTKEGDPIKTIAVVEKNLDSASCYVRVFIDSNDNYGFKGKRTSICKNMTLKTGECNTGDECEDLLRISRCENYEYDYII